MNPAARTQVELEDFLREVRQGASPLAPVACSGAAARRNTLSCAEHQSEELARLAHRPPPGLVLYKYGSRSVVGAYDLSDGTPVVLKYYYPKGIHKNLSYGITGSRGMRSWISALAFQYLGLPTPPAMLIAEWHALGGLWFEKSFLATGRVGGTPLSEWVVRHAADAPRLEGIADTLQRSFSLMARHRVSHGDLKSSNLIVAEDESISFVDLDGVGFSAAGNAWTAARERDKRIFLGNWEPGSAAAKAFAGVFTTSEIP